MGRAVVSVTPDLALDRGNTYAGGLGVLEGDKFYAAARLGMDYRVLTLYYANGYVRYEFDADLRPVPLPEPQPEEFASSLRVADEFRVRLRGEEVSVQALEAAEGSARAVFLRPVAPDWAARLADRVYLEGSEEERFLKYLLLARASEAYIRRDVGTGEVAHVDLQEAYAALLPLALRLPGKYRLVIHTPGPWGHPAFPARLLASECGYRLVCESVPLTELGLAAAERAFAVSRKHAEILSRVFPHHAWKLGSVTNGVDAERWTHPELRRLRGREPGLDAFIEARARARRSLESLLRGLKEVELDGRMLVAWARRMAPYKRPEFAARLAVELGDLPIVFVLGGRAHPADGEGLEWMRVFMRLHRERPNVVYLPNYGLREARAVLSGADVLLFTPFSGWEACGTSYMKAGMNGVPTISSRDGGALEMIEDGVNGWMFGEDLRDLVEYWGEEGRRRSELEYAQLRDLLLRVHAMFREDPESLHAVGLRAFEGFRAVASVERALREYYADVLGQRDRSAAYWELDMIARSSSATRRLSSSESPSSSATRRHSLMLYMQPGSGPMTSPV